MSESSGNGCSLEVPEEGVSADGDVASHREPENRHDLAEVGGQRLLDYSGDTDGELQRLENNLGAFYQVGEESPSEKTEYLIARGIHQAARGALGVLTDTEYLRLTLPCIRSQDSLLREEEIPGEQASDTFMRVAMAWSDEASQAVFAELDNPQHSYHRLWERYPAIYDRYFALQTVQDEHVANPADGWREGIEETFMLARNLLLAWGVSYARNKGGDSPPTAVELTNDALRNATRLSWLSTVGRERIGPLFVDTFADWEADPSTEDALAAIFSRDNATGITSWQSPYLKDGPKPVPRFCPGNLMLRPAIITDQQLVDGYLADIEARCGQAPFRDGHGTFNQATMILQNAAYLAEETIYADWPRSGVVG